MEMNKAWRINEATIFRCPAGVKTLFDGCHSGEIQQRTDVSLKERSGAKCSPEAIGIRNLAGSVLGLGIPFHRLAFTRKFLPDNTQEVADDRRPDVPAVGDRGVECGQVFD